MELKDIQAQLAEQTEQIEQERLAEVEKHSRELAERQNVEQKEIAENNARIKATEEHFAKLKKDKEEAEAIAKREDTASRVRLEAEQNAADERLTRMKTQAAVIAKQIEQAAFLEEQHKQGMRDMMSIPAPAEIATEDTSLFTGEAAPGTDGRTPETADMSEHLKKILRLK